MRPLGRGRSKRASSAGGGGGGARLIMWAVRPLTFSALPDPTGKGRTSYVELSTTISPCWNVERHQATSGLL